MKTEILPPTPANLRRMAALLRRGGLVAVPTETVYGLAAHALDAAACRRIFRAKRRPAYDPLIVHVAGMREAEKLAVWSDEARRLVRKFWPGPLTVVLPKRACVPGIVTSGKDSVALRSPAHPVMRRLLKLAEIPLAAPSANPFGGVSPTTAKHVVDGLGGRLRYVLDGGACPVGVESTIVDLRDPKRPVVLRPGKISRFQLCKAMKLPAVRTATRAGDGTPDAPGMLERHYSPKIPLTLVPAGRLAARLKRLGATDFAVFYRRPAKQSTAGTKAQVCWLTGSSGAAAARALYDRLRQADGSGSRRAYFELAPAGAGAIAEAINDRLTRAAGKG